MPVSLKKYFSVETRFKASQGFEGPCLPIQGDLMSL
jgi:hypothetical protein